MVPWAEGEELSSGTERDIHDGAEFSLEVTRPRPLEQSRPSPLHVAAAIAGSSGGNGTVTAMDGGCAQLRLEADSGTQPALEPGFALQQL